MSRKNLSTQIWRPFNKTAKSLISTIANDINKFLDPSYIVKRYIVDSEEITIFYGYCGKLDKNKHLWIKREMRKSQNFHLVDTVITGTKEGISGYIDNYEWYNSDTSTLCNSEPVIKKLPHIHYPENTTIVMWFILSIMQLSKVEYEDSDCDHIMGIRNGEIIKMSEFSVSYFEETTEDNIMIFKNCPLCGTPISI